jgi:hypothetical protein
MRIGVQDAAQTTQPAAAAFERRAGTPDWVAYSTSLRIPSAPGLPPQDSSGAAVSGNGMLLGLWVPPDALARLAPGQQLDADPNLGVVTSVASADDAGVVIAEAGRTHQISVRYDRRTGLGTEFQLEQQIGLGRTVLSLHVAG